MSENLIYASILATSVPNVAAEEKPNVVMIVVDDLGVNDLSLNGSKLYETEHIDALAKEAVNFSQAYTVYPRSVPSRYSLMTGRHCARPQEGAKSDDRKVLDSEYSIAKPFKDNGYETFIIGKWHLGPNPQHFDINIGAGKAGATTSYFAPFNTKKADDPDKIIIGMDDAPEGTYLTNYMTDKVVDYIKEEKDEPFFAICSYYAVHTPLQAEKDVINRFDKKIKGMNIPADPMMEEEAGFAKTQQDNAVYAAMIESFDEGVGKIVKALKDQGIYDNTIIVLTSDHGGLSNRGQNNRPLATTNAPLKAGKGHLYEGGVRVPLLIKAPQQKTSDVNEPVVNIDILPTLVDLCGMSVPSSVEFDGVSLKESIKGKKLEDRNLYWYKASERPYSTGDYLAAAIRKGDYKLLDFYRQDRVELYNIKNDPNETINLAPKDSKRVKAMLKELNEWREDIDVIEGKVSTTKKTVAKNNTKSSQKSKKTSKK